MSVSNPSTSRSHTFRIAKSTIAIILGGGAGTRLFPLTATRSKPAVPIAGKYRLVDIPISNCINSNINRMFVLTQFNSASLNKHIKNTYALSHFSSGFIDILAAEQTPDNPSWFQGTADAVRQSLRHVNQYDAEFILILSGDQLYQMDFEAMIDHHVDTGADISIATIPVGEKDASDFGIMKVSNENVITSFIEKPRKELLPDWISDTGDKMRAEGRIYLASMGIYIFNRKLLYKLLLEMHPSDTDFGKEILPASIHECRVTSYQYNGYWTDIGNIHSFFEANLALTLDLPPFNLFDKERAVYTRARMLPPAKISGTTVEKTMIAEGCIINASRIEHSVVGIRTRIGHGSTISRCYLMGSDYYQTVDEIATDLHNGIPPLGIGARCYLRNCIVDKDAKIGSDVTIDGSEHLQPVDTPEYTVKDGVVVIKKGAIIPDGFKL